MIERIRQDLYSWYFDIYYGISTKGVYLLVWRIEPDMGRMRVGIKDGGKYLLFTDYERSEYIDTLGCCVSDNIYYYKTKFTVLLMVL